MPALELRVAAATDVGLRRARNEDSLLAAFPVFVVADGMGGHDVGDRASQAVIAELQPLVGRADLRNADVASAVDRAHSVVRAIADVQPNGAGSTLTGAVVIEQDGGQQWLVFNIGDSRVYRWRGDALDQLTVDHSMAQELIDDGQLAKSDVATFAKRNVITRAVGADDSPADYWLHPIVVGDALVICSDGLTGELSDETISRILHSTSDPTERTDRLLSAALAAGGRDNVSVVVVDVVSVPAGVIYELPDGDDETTLEMPRRMSRG